MMRRWAFVVVMVLFAAGCGRPDGTDGSLVDDWSAPVEPKPFVPAAAVCHPSELESGAASLALYNPTDCAQSHAGETVHVGQFTGANANSSKPHESNTPAARAAFNDCDAKATEYAGAPWRTARLHLRVLFPSGTAWAGGARWYRCDLAEAADLDSGASVRRTASLRGALAAGSPLAGRRTGRSSRAYGRRRKRRSPTSRRTTTARTAVVAASWRRMPRCPTTAT
jgi:hypothetical protein